MKKMLLVNILSLSLFLFSYSLYSQEFINGNFNSNCIGNGFTAPSCVSGWYASHGNPYIQGDINKNTWATLIANKNGIEGIFTNYEFTVGKSYHISFKMKVATTINSIDKIVTTANLRATNELKSNFHTEKYSPNKSELIWTKGITKSSQDWENISISYTPKDNNSQLWFSISMSSNLNINESQYSLFEIDDISITTTGQKRSFANQKKGSNKEAINTNQLEYIFPETVNKDDLVNVRINSGEVSEIQIIDLAGSAFKADFTVLNKNYVNLKLQKNIYEGNYIVKVIKKDNTTITKKLTIK